MTWALTDVSLPGTLTHHSYNPQVGAPHLCQLRAKFLLTLQVGTLA